MDPIELLADARLQEIAADLMVQLEKGTGTRPVLWLLAETRKRASNALVMMMDVDPEDAPTIRRIQADVKLYDDMIAACRKMLARGREADSHIREAERRDLDELVMSMTDEQRRLHRLEPRGID